MANDNRTQIQTESNNLLHTALICRVPVSYTHLDVYKRQLLSSVTKGIDCRHFISVWVVRPVSYTHLAILPDKFKVGRKTS